MKPACLNANGKPTIPAPTIPSIKLNETPVISDPPGAVDELFNGIKKWTKNKYLLKYNKTEWIKYDTSLFYTNNKKIILF